MREFCVIAITPERIFPGEACAVRRLLESGAADRVHVRHPGCGADELRSLLRACGDDLWQRISVHDHYCLADEFAGIGVHENRRNGVYAGGMRDVVRSRSCHSIPEAREAVGYDYVTISPVYDSISKTGYAAAFDVRDAQLRSLAAARRIIALGGVIPEKFGELAEAGFAGAALSGFIWGNGCEDMDRCINEIIERRRGVCCNS